MVDLDPVKHPTSKKKWIGVKEGGLAPIIERILQLKAVDINLLMKRMEDQDLDQMVSFLNLHTQKIS